MKRIHTFHQLMAIVLIAWFVAPVCCCSAKSTAELSRIETHSCCQSTAKTDDDSQDRRSSECPCGKRTLIEGKAEQVTLSSPQETIWMIPTLEWTPEIIPPAQTVSVPLPQHLDLPPPGVKWFAISGSWLL